MNNLDPNEARLLLNKIITEKLEQQDNEMIAKYEKQIQQQINQIDPNHEQEGGNFEEQKYELDDFDQEEVGNGKNKK